VDIAPESGNYFSEAKTDFKIRKENMKAFFKMNILLLSILAFA